MKKIRTGFTLGLLLLSIQVFAYDRVCTYHMVCKGVTLYGTCPCANANSVVCAIGSVTSLCDGTSAGGALSGASTPPERSAVKVNKQRGSVNRKVDKY